MDPASIYLGNSSTPSFCHRYEEAKRDELGEGRPKNLATAFRCYADLSKAGHLPAAVKEAFFVCHGLGTPIDLSKAVELAQIALKKHLDPSDRGRAMLILGHAHEEGYWNGKKWVKDIGLAEEWYQKSYDLGDLLGGVFLAGLYFKKNRSTEGEVLIQKLISQLRQAAEGGDPIAQTRLGIFYGSGQGLEKDDAQMITWHRRSAEQGYARSQLSLGFCYANGRAVEQSFSEAVSWFRKAAEQGLPKALFNLGVCYEKGWGVAQDDDQATSYYRQSAEKGFDNGQYNLGVCYEEGYSVEQDYAQTAYWYRQAADQGFSPAQYNLGLLYENGQGVVQDHAKAARWYQQAAAQGHAEAQAVLKSEAYTDPANH
jgi:TPR repeat protein